MTSHRFSIDMSLRFFVIPFLIGRSPDFGFTTIPTAEWEINIELWQRTVGVYVLKLAGIGCNSSWMIALLRRVEIGNSLGLTQLMR